MAHVHCSSCNIDKFFPSGIRQIFFGHEQIFHKGLLVGIKIVLLPSLGRVQCLPRVKSNRFDVLT